MRSSNNNSNSSRFSKQFIQQQQRDEEIRGTDLLPSMGRFPADGNQCRRRCTTPGHKRTNQTKTKHNFKEQKERRKEERETHRAVTNKIVFLGKDVIEPDITSSLLLQAGDIESNPGPTCGTCDKNIKSGNTPLCCKTCNKVYHYATKCSGEPRLNIEKLKSNGLENWNCSRCRGTNEDDLEQEKCAKCKQKFRKAEPVRCTKCQ